MVGTRISSPHCSLFFSFFSIKYTFRFLFVISCLSRNYSFHSHKGKPFTARPLLFFSAVFFFTYFVYFAENFVSQFNFVALVVKSHIVLSFRKLDYVHRVILKPAEAFKTEIPFCSFRIWLICRYISLVPDQCWPTFYGVVTYKCCIQVVHGPAIQHTRDPNIEGAEGVRNV